MNTFSKNRKELLVILGPTATGKTDLALSLARKFNGELISADSRQVYRGLDIGTGKITGKFGSLKKEEGKWVVDKIPIHMYDVASPRRQYNVARFVSVANKIIWGIQRRKKLPILVGGTGLYIKAITAGLANLGIPFSAKLRKELEKLPLDQLQKKLQTLSRARWIQMNSSDRQNPRRLTRAIELEISKEDLSVQASNRVKELEKRFNILKIGLTAPKEILYQRVDAGVLSRIKQGMIKETKVLHKNGLSSNRMKQLGLEYGVLSDYITRDIKNIYGDKGLIEILQNKIHGFVRRQMTWFKKEKNINWFDITDKYFFSKVENTVSKWYYPN